MENGKVVDQGVGAEDPVDAEDQDERTWTPEEGDMVWVAGCVLRGWQPMGVVCPPGLTEGPRWAMGVWPPTREQSQLQAG